jgi:hypothetical protein
MSLVEKAAAGATILLIVASLYLVFVYRPF